MCNVIEDVVVVVVFMGRSSFDYEMYDSVSEKYDDSPVKKLYSGFIEIIKRTEYNSDIQISFFEFSEEIINVCRTI